MFKFIEKIEELIKFNNDMDVKVYYVNPEKIKHEKAMLIFDGNKEKFYIFVDHNLKLYEELKAIAHETGHLLRDYSTFLSRPFVQEMGENRAEVWACTYIIKYEDLVRTLKRYDITNDFEAAEELHVDIETLRKAIRRYELEGKPVRQWQFLDCWGT